MLMNDNQYLSVIENIKAEIGKSKFNATISLNRELVILYYNIGLIINEYKIWGNKFM